MPNSNPNIKSLSVPLFCPHCGNEFTSFYRQGPIPESICLCPECGAILKVGIGQLHKMSNTEINWIDPRIMAEIEIVRFLHLKFRIERGEV